MNMEEKLDKILENQSKIIKNQVQLNKNLKSMNRPYEIGDNLGCLIIVIAFITSGS